MSLSVYLAAAFSRQAEINQIREDLVANGVVVTSRWLTEQKDRPTESNKAAYLALRAQEDLDDIDKADVLVRFSDDLSRPTVSSHLATGSRMGEMLWAMAKDKPVVVVGGHQCIFDYLPKVFHVKNVQELMLILPALSKTCAIAISIGRTMDLDFSWFGLK